MATTLRGEKIIEGDLRPRPYEISLNAGSCLKMDELKRVFEEIVNGSKQVQFAVNEKTREAVAVSRSGLAGIEAAAAEKLEAGQGFITKIAEDYTHYENLLFQHLKGGVRYARENPGFAAGTAAGLLLLSFRGARRFLYTRTLGRFTSPEVMVETAEQRLQRIQQTVDVFKNDCQKLQERAGMAEKEFLGGRNKLRATGAELERLLSSVSRAQSQAQGLKDLLKELPARDSVRLRTQMATIAHEAKQQKHALDRQLVRIARLAP